ncbi:MAG: hypothetical protein ABW003_15205, partial [Microvirga sp.]
MRRLARVYLGVKRIDTTGQDPNENLAGSGFGTGHGPHTERSVVGVKNRGRHHVCCGHDLLLLISGHKVGAMFLF